ncbi:MAG TPA: hypothetical protein VL738_22055 [Dactylosporangium sp.]|jgi:hypothetical protein|nr:hypothetical protein [Dactylosporangium sp.]
MVEHGRAAEDIVEGGAGGLWQRSLALHMLGSEAEGVEAEFEYDTEKPAVELVRLVRELRTHLDRLSVREDAHLTFTRQCRACSGNGHVQDAPCDECDGSGATNSDPARRKGPSS